MGVARVRVGARSHRMAPVTRWSIRLVVVTRHQLARSPVVHTTLPAGQLKDPRLWSLAMAGPGQQRRR